MSPVQKFIRTTLSRIGVCERPKEPYRVPAGVIYYDVPRRWGKSTLLGLLARYHVRLGANVAVLVRVETMKSLIQVCPVFESCVPVVPLYTRPEQLRGHHWGLILVDEPALWRDQKTLWDSIRWSGAPQVVAVGTTRDEPVLYHPLAGSWFYPSQVCNTSR